MYSTAIRIVENTSDFNFKPGDPYLALTNMLHGFIWFIVFKKILTLYNGMFLDFIYMQCQFELTGHLILQHPVTKGSSEHQNYHKFEIYSQNFW